MKGKTCFWTNPVGHSQQHLSYLTERDTNKEQRKKGIGDFCSRMKTACM